MSLTINTGLTTNDGGLVSSGSFVEFETFFPAGELSYTVNIRIWRDQQSKLDGFQPLRGVAEIKNLSFSDELSEAEFSLLTPIVLHQYVQDYLENFLGENTVVIN